MPSHPMLSQMNRSTDEYQRDAQQQQQQHMSLQQRRKMHHASTNGVSSQGGLRVTDRSRNITRSASAIDLKITSPDRSDLHSNSLYVQPTHTTASAVDFPRGGEDNYPRSAGIIRTDGYSHQNQSAFYELVRF